MSSPPSLRPQLIPWPKPPQKWQDSRSSSYRDHNAGLGYESMPGDGASSGAQLLGAGKERVDQFPPQTCSPSRKPLFPHNPVPYRSGSCPHRGRRNTPPSWPWCWWTRPGASAARPPPAASPTPAVRAAQARNLPLRKGSLGSASLEHSGPRLL